MAFFRSLETIKQEEDWAKNLLDSGVLPSYKTSYVGIGALKNSDVLTAVSIIAGDVARFPILQVNDSDDSIGGDEDVLYLINKKSSEYVSAYTWKFSMMVNALLTGNAYTHIKRDPRNRGPQAKKPLELEFFSPSQTQVYEKGKKIRYKFTPENGQPTIDCDGADVIHWKFFSNDTILGRSPLLSLSEELELQQNGTNTLNKFFQTGLRSGLLKINKANLSKEARRKARQDFEYAQEGARGNSPVIVDATMEYTPLEVDTNVLNLVSSNNWSTSQIAKALRVPAYKLGVNSPNQSVKQLQEGYVKYDLPFYFQPIASEFQMKLLSDEDRYKYHFEFDIRKETGMLATDLATLVSNGIITPNEGRAEIGKKADDNEDMNRYQSTLNSVFLDKKEAYQDKADLKGGVQNGKVFENDSNSSGT
ncbi:phage portal protein [Lactobacillus terrae]|uniref:phage portal protein n=1 Tax=Lactobacillus terrae TaxID=2269374 RepID=UPI000C1B6B5D|nr:phage portal protein [Lactobacillus terrae]